MAHELSSALASTLIAKPANPVNAQLSKTQVIPEMRKKLLF
jgi:hypothetical protein